MSQNDSSHLHQHEKYMRRCIELAEIAGKRQNTLVGSVIVLNDEIVGEGIEALPNGNDITGHAEVLACQAAVDNTGHRLLTGATLYSTAEPCFMCSYLIRSAAISLVVYGSDTPVIGGVTSVHNILTDPRLSNWKPVPRVSSGVLLDECLALRRNS